MYVPMLPCSYVKSTITGKRFEKEQQKKLNRQDGPNIYDGHICFLIRQFYSLLFLQLFVKMEDDVCVLTVVYARK
jgi:hypothetical protein